MTHEPRCERTDLLIDQCGCSTCRPDLDVEERATSQRGAWFAASYAGRCSNCKSEFEPGDDIRADGFGNGGWLAECCGEDA